MPSLGVRATKMPPSAAAADADQVRGGQQPQRLAHRRAADAELVGELLLGADPLARLRAAAARARRGSAPRSARWRRSRCAGPGRPGRGRTVAMRGRIRDRKSPNVLQYSSARDQRAHRAHRDVRRAAPPRADDDLLEPRLDRGAVPRRAARRPAVRARAARGLRRRDGGGPRDRPRRAVARAAALDAGARQRRRRARHRARRTARRWSCSSASRTAATSRSSRSWPGACTGLAGDYPVWVDQPVRAAGRARARSSAPTTRPPPAAGPAIVIVPMDDWAAPAPGAARDARARRACCARRPPTRRRRRARRPARRAPSAPAIVVGAGADGEAGWAALVALAERLGCPVWQEPFGGQAGFPQDHPLLRRAPACPPRAAARGARAPRHPPRRGGGRLRQYPYDDGPAGRAGHAGRGRHAGPRGGAPQPGRARRARRPGRDLRRAGRGGRRAPGTRRPARERPAPPAAAAPTASRCAPATCSPRWPSACRATRSWSRRRRRAARSCTRASPPPRRSASSARWGCSASRCPPRSACGWRGRTGRC